jgi:hypothetical protein
MEIVSRPWQHISLGAGNSRVCLIWSLYSVLVSCLLSAPPQRRCHAGVFQGQDLLLPLNTTYAERFPPTHMCRRRVVTQGRKLEMVNSVLSSLASFYMCSIKVPITILEQVDKYRHHCLSRGGDTTSKKPPLASWKMVTKPKLKGGLGVLNLRLQNEALLLKNLHKFYNREELPWVQLLWAKYYTNGKLPDQSMNGSFWWRSILKTPKHI